MYIIPKGKQSGKPGKSGKSGKGMASPKKMGRGC